MTRNNTPVCVYRYRRQSNAFLRHKGFRMSLNSTHQIVVSRGPHSFGKFRVLTQTWKGRFDHQFFEMLQNVAAGGVLAPPPPGKPRQEQILPQKISAETRPKKPPHGGLYQTPPPPAFDHDRNFSPPLNQGGP